MKRQTLLTVWLLAASGLYLYAFPSATIAYFGVVLLHTALGLLLAALLLPILARLTTIESLAARLAWILLAAGAAIGVAFLFLGTPRRLHAWLMAHIVLSASGALLLVASRLASRGQAAGTRQFALRVATLLVLTAALAYGGWWAREVMWRGSRSNRISNPPIAPATMDQEGDGPQGRFFPSSAQTLDGGTIPAQYFMQSDACQRCHKDVYDQWNSSAHHFSSFNNQWYRKAVEYMQDVNGVKPSKWCAGCHDPALLFSGEFDTPIKQIVDRPESKAGLSCMMCHSIVQVKSTMGQGDFVLEYPKLHKLAASENPLLRTVHDFLVRLNPEPHRRTFLKPFMQTQTPEFCASCHKVHLDVPVNNYRWLRGFNEYDNWQASGVSGEGARSFYYPASPLKCPDCHMPLVPSKDDGNINGFVHSHRFPGANTALPFANQDQTQIELSRKFLQNGNLSVDIFALSRGGPQQAGGEAPGAELATTFAVGEEAEQPRPAGPAGEARALTAPLGRVDAAVRRGDDVRVDVVVRTKKVGHFFPGGTVDAFDVWLELQASDEKGQTLFWSGMAEDGGKGPVEPGAHFYRSLQIDAHGNPINKRNAWATRSVVYVRLIPPGAADTVHYRLHIPENAGEKITLHAKLNYRKFAWWNTQFAYAGVRDSGDAHPGVSKHYDDGKWAFTGDASHVSGNLHQIPDLPIIAVAEDTKSLRVLPRSVPAPAPQVALAKDDWVRWNDYGIGLFLQGDLRGAESAFATLTQLDPQNADGWVNMGRVRVQEGAIPGARAALEKALALRPDLARANYFYARVLKSESRFDEAAARLRSVLAQYPRDRVVRDELGRILFVQKRYAGAVREFLQVLEIDPEDLQANYNLMLCYNGLGDEQRANEYKARYLRFKADESAQTITGPYRQAHPEDNNERQAVHEHVSVALGPGRQ
ncbi:MAG: tetratricopeptide repeat protein [Acidobacteriia bacterium]|nr:tetratricopeptide repeat protein [Terriglobia bacterium]